MDYSKGFKDELVAFKAGNDEFFNLILRRLNNMILSKAWRWSLESDIAKAYHFADLYNIFLYKMYECLTKFIIKDEMGDEVNYALFVGMLSRCIANKGSDLKYEQTRAIRKPKDCEVVSLTAVSCHHEVPECIDIEIIDEVRKSLTKNQYRVFNMVLDSMPVSEIASRMHCHKSEIDLIMKHIRLVISNAT